jgi:imidazole glycerol-phosphate synthase subunit HisF
VDEIQKVNRVPNMANVRVIACLTLMDQGGYRTRRFNKPRYIGDPVVAVKIFNEKEVDEMLIVDISRDRTWNNEKLELLHEIASEAFMPMAYGGNISSIDEAARMFRMGYEKVAINTAALRNQDLIEELVGVYGSQSIIGALDVKKGLFGDYKVYGNLGRTRTGIRATDHAERLVKAGAGELLVNSIDRDGSMEGLDLKLVRSVVDRVSVPVIAMGGAGSIDDLSKAVTEGQASAVCAGSLFVYQGSEHRGVLINYPKPEELKRAFPGKI